jgi:hypothetical protein
MTRRRADHRITTLLAQECARLIAEEGVQDFRTAKRKAAVRIGIPDKAALPDNSEIEQALLDRQRLFHADHQARYLRGLRETALEAMGFLARFRPRLVGPVLSGAAGPHTTVHLHLFADPSEDVPLFLMEHRIPFTVSERRFKMTGGALVCQPVFGFTVRETAIELTVFALLAEREAPRSSVDGRPMRRASLAQVQALLAVDPSP